MSHFTKSRCPHCSAASTVSEVSKSWEERIGDNLSPPIDEARRDKTCPCWRQPRVGLTLLFVFSMPFLLTSTVAILSRWFGADVRRTESPVVVSTMLVLAVASVGAAISWFAIVLTIPNVGSLRWWGLSATLLAAMLPGLRLLILGAKQDELIGSGRGWESFAVVWLWLAFLCFSMFLISLARYHASAPGTILGMAQLFVGSGLFLGWAWMVLFDPRFSLVRSVARGPVAWDARLVEAIFLIWQVTMNAALIVAARAIRVPAKSGTRMLERPGEWRR